MAVKDKAIAFTVFLMFLQAVPGLMVASGIAADMGVDPSISGGENINDANQQLSDIKPEGGFGSTLFSLYTSLSGPFKTLMEVAFGAELMFISLGMPGWLVNFMMVPKAVVVGGGMIYMLAGRRL